MAIRESAKCFTVLWLGCTLIIMAEARAKTVQIEIDALRVIANNLGVSWNFSVDPCSGLENWNDTAQIDSFGNKEHSTAASGVKCSCNYNRNTTCHVLELKVVNQDKRGQIPPEIGNFTQLTELNLGLNILTGTLPEEIGKLVNMKHMDIGHNRLSGTIPPQIGYLASLISLGIGTNNFSGSMPKEFENLGNLTCL